MNARQFQSEYFSAVRKMHQCEREVQRLRDLVIATDEYQALERLNTSKIDMPLQVWEEQRKLLQARVRATPEHQSLKKAREKREVATLRYWNYRRTMLEIAKSGSVMEIVYPDRLPKEMQP